MNINTQPWVLERNKWQFDLVFRVLHDDEVKYFRPAVGDFINDVQSSTLTKLDVNTLLDGDSRVLIQTLEGTTEYTDIHFEYALMWGQWLKYMNPTCPVHIVEMNTQWSVVMPNTDAMFQYIGMVAQGDPDRKQFMADPALKHNIDAALIKQGIIPEPTQRIITNGSYSRVESKKGS